MSTTAAAELAPLGPECYLSADWFAREHTAVFERHWHFAGFRDELREPGDYVTLRLGRASVVVRRGEQELLAFRNVCSHRHAIILSNAAGHGPLRCNYHGWTYDDRGYPIGLPGCRDDFGLTEEERCGLSLERFAVDAVGPLVFVRVADSGPSLRDYLGNLATVIDRWEGVFALPFDRGEFHWAANWKAGVENTLEPYHGPFVHSETLAHVTHQECEYGLHGKHSTIRHQLKDNSLNWWDRMSQVAHFTPVPGARDYWHYFVYPNLCIGLTYGALLSVQTFEPAAPGTCTLRYRLSLPRGDAGSSAMRGAIEGFLSEFNQEVLKEDQGPVEACQRGYGQTTGHALLGHSECRVAAFQRAIQDDIGNGTERNGHACR